MIERVTMKPTEMYDMMVFLHKEACHNYNKTPREDNDDKWYFEGKKMLMVI